MGKWLEAARKKAEAINTAGAMLSDEQACGACSFCAKKTTGWASGSKEGSCR